MGALVVLSGFVPQARTQQSQPVTDPETQSSQPTANWTLPAYTPSAPTLPLTLPLTLSSPQMSPLSRTEVEGVSPLRELGNGSYLPTLPANSALSLEFPSGETRGEKDGGIYGPVANGDVFSTNPAGTSPTGTSTNGGSDGPGLGADVTGGAGGTPFPSIWTVREAQPEVYYLPDAKGALVPVPGFTLQNFGEMLKICQQRARSQETPPWSIQAINATGVLLETDELGDEDGIVDLLTEFTIRTTDDGLVRVPLLMDGAVFLRDEGSGTPESRILSYEEDAGGFVCRFSGTSGGVYTLRLRFLVPVSGTAGMSRFRLAFPRATYSLLQIDLPPECETAANASDTTVVADPATNTELVGTAGMDGTPDLAETKTAEAAESTGTAEGDAHSADEATTLDLAPLQVRVTQSGSLLTVNDSRRRDGESQIVVRGQGGPCDLTWSRQNENESSVSGEGEVVGNIRAVIWPRGGIRLTANLSVRRQGEIKRIRVRLPQGAVLIPDAEGDAKRGYTVSLMDDLSTDLSGCRLVEVRFAERENLSGTVEVTLTADLGYDMLVGATAIGLNGFEVIGIPQQSGEISLIGVGDWKINPETLVGARQKDDPYPKPEPGLLGTFEYYTQPFTLPVRILAKKPHLSVSGEYSVFVTPDNLQLDAVFDGNVTQAELQSLEFPMAGWTFDTATGEGVALGAGRVDEANTLRLPLQRSVTGRFRLRLRAHRALEVGAEPVRFELPRPVCDATGSFILNVSARSEMLLIPEPDRLRGLVRIGRVSQFRSTPTGGSLLPVGTLPSRSPPLGVTPPNATSPGSIPPNAVPPGSIPPGSIPTGGPPIGTPFPGTPFPLGAARPELGGEMERVGDGDTGDKDGRTSSSAGVSVATPSAGGRPMGTSAGAGEARTAGTTLGNTGAMGEITAGMDAMAAGAAATGSMAEGSMADDAERTDGTADVANPTNPVGTTDGQNPETMGTDAPTEFRGATLRYRVSPDTAFFTGTFRTLEQKMDLFSTTELRMRANQWEVLQRFRYRVRNLPAEQLFLEVPSEMADLPLEATFNGQPVVWDTMTTTVGGTNPVANSTNGTASAGTVATTANAGTNTAEGTLEDGTSPATGGDTVKTESTVPRFVRKRIQLPEPLLGEGELQLRYPLNQTFLPDAFGEAVTIPLILPEAGELRRQLCLIRTPEMVRTSVADPDWEIRDPAVFRQPIDFNTSWMSLSDADAVDSRTNAVGRTTGEMGSGEQMENLLCLATESRRRELAIELRRDDSQDNGTTFIERGWVRSWFAGRVREDRAVFLIRNNTRRSLTLELPPGVLPANVRVWLDGQLIHGIPDVRTPLFELIPQQEGEGKKERRVENRSSDPKAPPKPNALPGGIAQPRPEEPRVVSSLSQESNLRLIVAMPPSESRVHCLEMVCQFLDLQTGVSHSGGGTGNSKPGGANNDPRTAEEPASITRVVSRPGGMAVRLPHFTDDVRVHRMYWEIVLPGNEFLLAGPSQCVSEQTYTWNGPFCSRRPGLDTAELEIWSGSRFHSEATGRVNRYLFSTVGTLTQCEIRTMSRSTLVVLISGVVLLMGLLTIYLRSVWNSITVLVLSVVFLTCVLTSPELTILGVQASIPGWVALGMAVVIQRRLPGRLYRSTPDLERDMPVSEGFGTPVVTQVPVADPERTQMREAVTIASDVQEDGGLSETVPFGPAAGEPREIRDLAAGTEELGTLPGAVRPETKESQ